MHEVKSMAPVFSSERVKAAKEFAQTMVVVDDEASQLLSGAGDQRAGRLRRPNRRDRTAIGDLVVDGEAQGEVGRNDHPLDAKVLIDNAMELGMICSVLRPAEGENISRRVQRAVAVADIVCLDWDIYGDGGDAVSMLVRDIIREDIKRSGRLRLIAIYTADTLNTSILEKVFESIPRRVRELHQFRVNDLDIVSENGTKVVCLYKTHALRIQGPRSANQVSENDLPKRLQEEFASLSDGLLSNIALATMGAIRASTHHVLAKFSGNMDGPYFHHRAALPRPVDAEEYAVNIVLSEFANAVNKKRIGESYAGETSISSRIREIANGNTSLKLQYGDNANGESFDLEIDVSTKMITKGLKPILKDEKPKGAPGNKSFHKDFSTLFANDQKAGRAAMHQFAALTGVRRHPETHLYRSGDLVATLGLGTIVACGDSTYLMCLQASCDAIRIKGRHSFLFVPLEPSDDNPEHVVPDRRRGVGIVYVGLNTSGDSYRALKSLDFVGSKETGTVNARKIKYRSGYFFEDANGETYRWVADLKRRRALRTAQRVGGDMGRLGFDEFEPYRR